MKVADIEVIAQGRLGLGANRLDAQHADLISGRLPWIIKVTAYLRANRGLGARRIF